MYCKTFKNLMRGMCIVGIAVMTMAFMQSCDKTTNENNPTGDNNDPIVENNPFIGTWVASGSYDNEIPDNSNSTHNMSGTFNYSITITNDYRCHLVGTHNVTVRTPINNVENYEVRTDDYYLVYDITGNNCIMTQGRTPKEEDGLYLDGSLCLLKNDNTLTGDVYLQGRDHSHYKRYIKREIDFVRE